MLIAVAADKGSPGVSLTALGMALGWPREVLLAECDPAGSDLVRRTRSVAGQSLSSATGVVTLASALRERADDRAAGVRVWDHVQHADGGLPVLVGPAGPEQAEAIGEAWSQVAAALAGTQRADVVADCGRFLSVRSPAAPVLQAADLVVLVVRPSAPGVAHLRHGVETCTRLLDGDATTVGRPSGADGRNRVGVVVVDDRAAGGRSRRGAVRLQVERVLADSPGLEDVPVLGVMRWDVRAAASLTGEGWGWGMSQSMLLRSGAEAARTVYDRVSTDAHRRVADEPEADTSHPSSRPAHQPAPMVPTPSWSRLEPTSLRP